ncbi:MAG TPA: hypothetical protein PKB04_07010, partial [Phenylobacterium sp.]|nr:hypothetical protein [Phenylobacterium sp.]
ASRRSLRQGRHRLAEEARKVDRFLQQIPAASEQAVQAAEDAA